jgi:hypothetical protein
MYLGVIIACSKIGMRIALTNVACVSLSVGETARPQRVVELDHGERPPWDALLHSRNKIQTWQSHQLRHCGHGGESFFSDSHCFGGNYIKV